MHKVIIRKADDLDSMDSRVKWIAACQCGWKQGTGTRDKAAELRARHLHPHPSLDTKIADAWNRAVDS